MKNSIYSTSRPPGPLSLYASSLWRAWSLRSGLHVAKFKGVGGYREALTILVSYTTQLNLKSHGTSLGIAIGVSNKLIETICYTSRNTSYRHPTSVLCRLCVHVAHSLCISLSLCVMWPTLSALPHIHLLASLAIVLVTPVGVISWVGKCYVHCYSLLGKPLPPTLLALRQRGWYCKQHFRFHVHVAN